jgi:phytoene dehydrogenase-like protein
MAPPGQDCFYVLVPVPNNQSKIDWSVEGEKMKNLVIDKMEKDLMPNLRENIVEDFYLTPDYFEKDLILNMVLVFQSNQNFHNQLILDFIINLRYMMDFIL